MKKTKIIFAAYFAALAAISLAAVLTGFPIGGSLFLFTTSIASYLLLR